MSADTISIDLSAQEKLTLDAARIKRIDCIAAVLNAERGVAKAKARLDVVDEIIADLAAHAKEPQP